MTRRASALLAAALALGCGAQPAVDRGRDLFASPAFSSSHANVFSCATCHATAADPARRQPGYTMAGVVGRPSWWGGAYDLLVDAVNECYVGFMRGERLAPEATDGRALLVYLESLSPEPSTAALPLTVVKDIVDVPRGDAARGAAAYLAACAPCHGERGTGKDRLGPLVSVLPDSTLATFGTDPITGARPITIEKTRHGKFFNIGGVMPLFSIEALSDAEVSDILSYLGLDL